MNSMIGIIDYQAGNITSVARALKYLGHEQVITDDARVLDRASHIIFPGVGAAGEAMINLKKAGLDRLLTKCFTRGKPLLGICLGAQVILEFSEEADTPCLGLVPGSARRFPEGLADRGEFLGKLLKVPHMGWNQVHFRHSHPVFQDIPSGGEFYFVHSYFPVPADDECVAGWTDYGIGFCSVVARENLVAVQFHAEKSGRLGLKLLDNFCRWDGRYAK